MGHITTIQCPKCGKHFDLKSTVAEASVRAFLCPICETTFKIAGNIISTDKGQQPVISATPTQQDTQGPNTLFYNGVVLIREEDGYPYLFFNSRTTFGRYDQTMQAEVLCLTDDTSMSRQHVAFNLKRIQAGVQVSMTCLCNGVAKAGATLLAMGETVVLSDGMCIRLGKTDFTIRDINQNDI